MPRAISSNDTLTENAKVIKDALWTASAEMNETNDCTVKALAVVTGKSYKKAHAALAKRGRKPRTGAYNHQFLGALEDLGYKAVNIDPRTIIETYPGAHGRVLKHVTTHHPERFPLQWSGQRRFLFGTSRHLTGVRDGEVIDWARGRAKRVTQLWEVRKLTDEGKAVQVRPEDDEVLVERL